MKAIRVFLSVLFGVYFTHFAIEINLLTPVVASALTGLIGSIFFVKNVKLPNHIGASIYCGSFMGMGSALTTIELLPTSLLCVGVIFLFEKRFKGFGGKLGFTAYISSIIMGVALALKQQTFSFEGIINGFQPIANTYSIIAIGLAVITGFYSTVYINHNLNKSAVLASALPSFLVGWLALTNLPNINLFVATFFSASFAGMLAETLLSKKLYPTLMFALILITVVLKTMLGKFGGSLGTMAFLSVSSLVFIHQLGMRSEELRIMKKSLKQ